MTNNPSEYIKEKRDLIHAILEGVYEEAGPGAIYDLLPGDARCEGCEAETPSVLDTCAICGQTGKL